jgi:hypothetical protein
MYHLKVCDFRNIKYAQIPGEKIPMQYVRDGAVLLKGSQGIPFTCWEIDRYREYERPKYSKFPNVCRRGD